jgi:hypothetical protein
MELRSVATEWLRSSTPAFDGRPGRVARGIVMSRLCPTPMIVAAVFGLLRASCAAADPVVLLSGQYGAPARYSGSLAVLIPVERSSGSDTVPVATTRGPLIGATGGAGAGRLELGYVALVSSGSPIWSFGFDGRASIMRTWESAKEAAPGSTYIGLEAGIMLSLVRLSVGVGQRIAGASGDHGTIITWSAGIQVPIGGRD